MEEYSRRIEMAQHNAAELGRIADELQALSNADATRLRYRAIKLRMQLKSGISRTPQPSKSASAQPLPRWLTELGLPAIDGRPLYRYRLSDEAFAGLQAALKSRAADIVACPTPLLAAQFVLLGRGVVPPLI